MSEVGQAVCNYASSQLLKAQMDEAKDCSSPLTWYMSDIPSLNLPYCQDPPAEQAQDSSATESTLGDVISIAKDLRKEAYSLLAEISCSSQRVTK